MLRFYKLGLSIFAVVFVLTQISCNYCEPDSEPTAEISFYYPKNFTLVYGLREDDVVTAIPPGSAGIWRIPISIAKDKTTIIFKTDNSSDTLTIAYERNVRFQSQECGMRIFFENIQITEPTSFNLISIIEESSNNEIASISVQDE